MEFILSDKIQICKALQILKTFLFTEGDDTG